MKLTFTQVIFIFIIIIVGIIVYQELPQTSELKMAMSSSSQMNTGCPVLTARQCVIGNYGRVKKVCPPAPDECNGQQDVAVCFRYKWKDPRRTPCPVCDSPNYSKKIAVKCK